MPTFTFDIDPNSQTGDFLVDILVPNNALNAASLNFSIGATDAGATDTSTISPVVATLQGDWTSGKLENFLGLPLDSGSPANPLAGFVID